LPSKAATDAITESGGLSADRFEMLEQALPARFNGVAGSSWRDDYFGVHMSPELPLSLCAG